MYQLPNSTDILGFRDYIPQSHDIFSDMLNQYYSHALLHNSGSREYCLFDIKYRRNKLRITIFQTKYPYLHQLISELCNQSYATKY
jgi:hypothetical protein